MDWATKRQLEYLGIIFLAVIVFIVIPFFVFIYKAPTCFDGMQNGGETGIDCGGACRLLCTAQIAMPISRWDPRIFKVTGSTYTVLAYMENPNVAAEVLNAPYSFKLYDAQNILITERTGTTYIPKGGNFAVLEANIQTGDRVPTRATFQFTKSLTWIRNTNPSPTIEVSNKALMSESTAPRVEATVKNTTLDRVPNIDLTAIVYDGAGNAIGASRTYIEALEATQSKDVTFTWPAPFATKAEVCANPVDIMIAIDRSGSMAAFGKEPPQPLTDVKNAAIYFANQLDQNDKAGLVSFANEAATTSEVQLTSSFESLKKSIEQVVILPGPQNTNIADALSVSAAELFSVRHRENIPGVIVLLTDGVPTAPTKTDDPQYPVNLALSAATQIKSLGTRIFTIGLGKDINTSFLQTLATTPDDYYPAPTAKELTKIYSQIATKICTKKPAYIEVIPRLFPYHVAF